jgi:anaphase-promoting complex subunit 1
MNSNNPKRSAVSATMPYDPSLDGPITVPLQGSPLSGGVAFLEREQGQLNSHNPSLEHKSSSRLLQDIRAALRGSGCGVDDAPVIRRSVQPLSDEAAGEEELAWSARTVCLSHGGILRKRWNFVRENESVRWACMGWLEQKIGGDLHHSSAAHASAGLTATPTPSIPSNEQSKHQRPAFGPFSRASTRKARDPEHAIFVRAVFVFLRTTARIFLMSGVSHTVALPFLVRRAWPAFPQGVLIQRCLDPREIEEAAVAGDAPLPSLFSLTSPFAEIAAVGLTKGIVGRPLDAPFSLEDDEEHSRRALVTVPASEAVVWISDLFGKGPPETLLVTVDTEARKLSIWRYAYIPPRDLPVPLMRSRQPAGSGGAANNTISSGPSSAAVSPVSDSAHLPPLSMLPNLPPTTTPPVGITVPFSRPTGPDPDTPARERKEAVARLELSMSMNRMGLSAPQEILSPPTDHGRMKASYWMQRLISQQLDALEYVSVTRFMFGIGCSQSPASKNGKTFVPRYTTSAGMGARSAPYWPSAFRLSASLSQRSSRIRTILCM